MRRVKLYGGPAHGREEVFENRTRIFFRQPPRFNIYEARNRLPFDEPLYQECSYYLHRQSEQMRTFAGALVHREMWIGLWEDGELHIHEESNIRRALGQQPWVWRNKLNILYNFDQWWERELYLIGRGNLFY